MNAPVLKQDVAAEIPAGVIAETVTFVHHYTDRLFRFRMTRPESFRFPFGRVRDDRPHGHEASRSIALIRSRAPPGPKSSNSITRSRLRTVR